MCSTHPGSARSRSGSASHSLCPCLSSGKLCLAHGSHHAGRVGVAEGETGGGVDGCWRGQDVSRVAEGWEMAHGCHVSSQGSRTEWG